MKREKIMLKTINDVKAFVNAVAKYNFDVDLLSGRYAVDANSLQCLISVDLSKEIEMEVHSDDCADFLNDIKPFIVK